MKPQHAPKAHTHLTQDLSVSTSLRTKKVLHLVLFTALATSLPLHAQPLQQPTPAANLDPREADWKTLMEEAGAFYNAQRFDLAAHSGEEALAYCREHFDRRHLNTASTLYTLAEIYFDLGNLERAAELAKESLSIRSARLDFDDILIAASANSLAQIYQAMGQFGKARPLNQRALTIWRVQKGKHHPYVAVSLNNLGKIDHARGLYHRAKAAQAEDPATALELRTHATNDFQSAAAQYEEARDILIQHLEPDDQNFGATLFNLAESYAELERWADAEPLYRDALKIAGPVMGREHPHVVMCTFRLAIIEHRLGKLNLARRFYDTAVAWAPDALSPEQRSHHIDLLNSAIAFYEETNAPEEAEACRTALQNLQHPQNPDTTHTDTPP